jgi:rhodanese-related sulfurtransferase
MPLSFPLAVLAVVSALLSLGPARAEGQQCLSELERKVETDHPTVRSLLPQQFRDMTRDQSNVVVLDVRNRSEFDVSHIPGAEHVEPDMTADAFMARFGDRIAGKTVVLYCSVGVRSSRLAHRIDASVRASGGLGAHNLRGGIFAWHNYGKQLRDQGVATDHVHPYSRSWSRYLDFPDFARYR